MISSTAAFGARPARAAAFAELERPFDLLVVGGGVNGLAIAWDAALAGLSVAVVDKGDWGSGTSSWSSRMVHGGLKYLERYDVRLVRESLLDREWLLRHASHLVKPLPFILPSYSTDGHSRIAIRVGMLAYDALSMRKSVPRHTNYSREELIAYLPGLRREGLRGASRYFDAQVEYAERLCVELMLGAQAAGAVAINYAAATSLVRDGNRVVGARVVDQLTQAEHTVLASVTMNVAGPWVDDLMSGTPLANRRWIGGTKGTHLVVDPFDGAPGDAIYFESDDGRPMMVIPWLGRYLIGSTDKRFTGDLDTASPDEEEIDYILFETNKAFPIAGLSRASIRYWYTGVRPLPYVSDGKTADISRRHEIHDHAPELEGLLTVVGGKLTTFRALARHALSAIGRKIPIPGGESRLGEQVLPGFLADGVPAGDGVVERRLARIYGARAGEILTLAEREPETARELDPEAHVTVAEVLFVVRTEQAVHLGDVLARRTMVGLEPDLGRGVAPEVAATMAAELGWSPSELAEELDGYERYLRRFEVFEGRHDAAAAGD
jgi:glycerol-3-phosphate dehydrogenase